MKSLTPALSLAVALVSLPGATGAELALRIPAAVRPEDLRLELTGEPLRTYQLQRSTDLSAWTPVSTLSTSSGGSALYRLGDVRGQPATFFRAVLRHALPYVPGRILFALKPSPTAAALADIARAAGLDDAETIVLNQSAGPAGLIYSASTRLPVPEVLAVLRAHPAVAHAEPDHLLELLDFSNDPFFVRGEQWGMCGDNSSPLDPFGSQAAEAWADGYLGAPDVVIAITDSGVQVDHPDLAPNIWVNPLEIAGNGLDDDGNGLVDDVHGWNFAADSPDLLDEIESDAHGTHVAGIIGAVGGNDLGVAGVAWRTRLMCLKFFPPKPGAASEVNLTNRVYSDAIRAVRYASAARQRGAANVRAINVSWRVLPGVEPELVRFLYQAFVEAANADILLVAGAGNATEAEPERDNDRFQQLPSNFDTNVPFEGRDPAAWDAVIAVAALDFRGNLPAFSHYGATTVDLAAPGDDIVSTLPGSRYGSMDGTSMAAPHVTGAIALYAAAYPQASGRQIKQALLASVAPTPSLQGKTVTGGRLDARHMLDFPPQNPTQPVPLEPACDAPEVAPRPWFRWTVADNTLAYVLRVAPTDGSEPERVYTPGAVTEFTPPEGQDFAAQRTYVWTVTGKGAEGQDGPPSVACRFTVRSPLIPPSEAPLALSPLCGTTQVSPSPEFRWSAVARADAYVLRLYVGEPSDAPARIYTLPTAVFHLPPSEPLTGGLAYSYQVAGWNAAGEGPRSEACHFKVRWTDVLSPPKPQTPRCGEVGARRATLFTWTAVEGAARYRLLLAADTITNLVERRETVVTEPRHQISETEFLRGNRHYHWQVRAETDAVLGEWSPWCDFVTAFDPPTPDNPTCARGGARRTPTFTWSAIPGALQYRFELSVDRPGNEVEHRAAIETGTAHPIPESEPLRAGRQYFWRVRAEAGQNLGAWSPWCSFWTAFPAPTPQSPECGRTGVRRATEFTWSRIDGAPRYRFRLSVDTPGDLVKRREAVVDVPRLLIPEDDTLEGNRQYFWQVRAESDENTGDWCDWCAFRTRP